MLPKLINEQGGSEQSKTEFEQNGGTALIAILKSNKLNKKAKNTFFHLLQFIYNSKLLNKPAEKGSERQAFCCLQTTIIYASLDQ